MKHLDDIMLEIHATQTRRELWALLFEYLTHVGVTMASYHPTKSDGTPDKISAQGFPETWVCQYIGEQLVHIDPIPELAARSIKPFYWHDAAELVPTTQKTERYLELFEKSGVGDGIALYVFGPAMQNAYVGLGFGKDWVDLSPKTLWEIQCVAQAGHIQACHLKKIKETPQDDLTPREHEILRWVARGKSNAVIADILSISPHTVDAHIRHIYAKLGVNDRTSAALRGVGSGLIHIEG